VGIGCRQELNAVSHKQHMMRICVCKAVGNLPFTDYHIDDDCLPSFPGKKGEISASAALSPAAKKINAFTPLVRRSGQGDTNNTEPRCALYLK
jgi:hypothetical protein